MVSNSVPQIVPPSLQGSIADGRVHKHPSGVTARLDKPSSTEHVVYRKDPYTGETRMYSGWQAKDIHQHETGGELIKD